MVRCAFKAPKNMCLKEIGLHFHIPLTILKSIFKMTVGASVGAGGGGRG